MCIAEALLRVPDDLTQERLIRDKLSAADWDRHLGRSASVFVNASTWALMLTGRLVRLHDAAGQSPGAVMRRLVARLGEPVVREAVNQAMRILGRQFVMGRSIDQALERARPLEARGYRFSYDMLGEAARTMADADRYHQAYRAAIAAIGAAARQRDVVSGPGISVKLSALHPRYEAAQAERVASELVPRVRELAVAAAEADIALTIDAEEADRLDLSLDVIEALADDRGARRLGRARRRGPDLPEDRAVRDRVAGGSCPADAPAADGAPGQGRLLGRRDQAGAGAGAAGLPGLYPQGLDRRLLPRLRPDAAGRADAVLPAVRDPQRPLHRRGAGGRRRAAATSSSSGCTAWARPCTSRWWRRTASASPAGSTRRSAGTRTCSPTWSAGCSRTAPTAPSSTASRTTGCPSARSSPIPVARVRGLACIPHPRIFEPRAMFLPERLNSTGIDLGDRTRLARLAEEMSQACRRPWLAGPIVGGSEAGDAAKPVVSPADRGPRGGPGGRGRAGASRGRAGCRRRERAGLGGHRGRGAGGLPGARRRPARTADGGVHGDVRRRGRQDPAGRGGRGPRGRRLLPLLRRPGAKRPGPAAAAAGFGRRRPTRRG